MTDEQIEKALECCNADKNICVECPYYYTNCNYVLTQDALDLIRRQKAQLVEQMLTVDAECDKCIAEAKAEAIREFAERMDGVLDLFAKGLIEELELYDKIASLKKEMTEEQK